jgi:hypothetical protein
MKQFLILTIHIVLCFSQTQFQKNEHVEYSVSSTDGFYNINYKFKDAIFEPFPDKPEVHKSREKIIHAGLFKVRDNTVIVDKSALIKYYLSYCEPIAARLVYYLKKEQKDTRQDRIELVMKFVQDIPYAIPSFSDHKLHYGGVTPIPSVLINGWGDCDSKAFLFVGILSYMIDTEDIRFAGEPGHLYTVIRNDKNNIVPHGNTTYFTIDEQFYLVAETAGPGRFPFGMAAESDQSSANIEPFYIGKIIPIGY